MFVNELPSMLPAGHVFKLLNRKRELPMGFIVEGGSDCTILGTERGVSGNSLFKVPLLALIKP